MRASLARWLGSGQWRQYALIVALIAAFAFFVTAKDAEPAEYHPGRVIVKWKGEQKIRIVHVPPGRSVSDEIRRQKKDPRVLYAEPDYILHTLAIPNDPLLPQQWDLSKIHAFEAWDVQTDAPGPIIAVVDTGSGPHPDLDANLLPGWTCLNGVVSPGGQDDHFHGTHVAGTIAAVGNNGLGVAGLLWRARIMPFKFLAANGSGSTSDAIRCFQKIAELRAQGVPIRVTNNSWGGGGFSQALLDAMRNAGTLNIVAAGNSAQDIDEAPTYPAAYDGREFVSVCASDQNDAAAYFSNVGLARVDLCAPGVGILSTLLGGIYGNLNGTSMAAPHVAAVALAIFQANPGATPEQVRDMILATTDPVSGRAAISTTGGRLNYARALAAPVPAVLNAFPTLSVGPDVAVVSGQPGHLEITASDPDGDQLRLAWRKKTGTWLWDVVMAGLPFSFPDFTAPPVARTVRQGVVASVADGRGGSALGQTTVQITPAPNTFQPPVGTLSVTPQNAAVGQTVTITYFARDPDTGQTVPWEVWRGRKTGLSAGCCLYGETSFSSAVPDVQRVSVRALDRQMQSGARETAVVRIGGMAGEPPLARLSVDRIEGPTPLTVQADASASTDQDGLIAFYTLDCGNGDLSQTATPWKTCTYTTPGNYSLGLIAQDNQGFRDREGVFIVATVGTAAPPPPPPPPPKPCHGRKCRGR